MMPERTAYIKEVEALLEEYDREIEKVRGKIAASAEPSRIRGIEKELVDMRTEIQEQLRLIKRADAASWQEFRLGIDTAQDKLTMNLANAMEELEADTQRR
jgi:hypothetical protein